MFIIHVFYNINIILCLIHRILSWSLAREITDQHPGLFHNLIFVFYSHSDRSILNLQGFSALMTHVLFTHVSTHMFLFSVQRRILSLRHQQHFFIDARLSRVISTLRCNTTALNPVIRFFPASELPIWSYLRTSTHFVLMSSLMYNLLTLLEVKGLYFVRSAVYAWLIRLATSNIYF